MKPTLSAVAAIAIFRYAFRASWKISLLAGAATFGMLATPALVWGRKNEKLGDIAPTENSVAGIQAGAVGLTQNQIANLKENSFKGLPI